MDITDITIAIEQMTLTQHKNINIDTDIDKLISSIENLNISSKTNEDQYNKMIKFYKFIMEIRQQNMNHINLENHIKTYPILCH